VVPLGLSRGVSYYCYHWPSLAHLDPRRVNHFFLDFISGGSSLKGRFLLLVGFLCFVIWIQSPQTIDRGQAAPQQEVYLELKEFSEHFHHEDGTITFSSRLGDQNTWDGSSYQYYVWDDIEKKVQFAQSKLYFFDWYAKLYDLNNYELIKDMRWQVEYWREQGGGEWRTLDLYIHEWYNPVVGKKNITFIQGYNDGVNFLNVSYIVTNNAQVKVNIDYLAGEERKLRFVWQLTGMEGSLGLNMTKREFQFADIIISCNDTDPSVGFDYEWVTSTKKLDLRIGSYAVILNEWIHIDPTFSEKQETDARDFYVQYSGAAYSAGTSSTADYAGCSSSNTYRSFIAWDSGITDSIASTSSAEMTIYLYQELVEASEYIAFSLYDKGDTDEYWNETEADEDAEGAYTQNNYWEDTSFHAFDGESCNVTITDAKTGTLIDNWVSHHNSDPSGRQFIAIKMFEGTDIDSGTDDYISFRESSYATAANRPTLTFTYEIGGGGNNAPNAPTLDTDSGDTYGGKSFSVITNHTDDDGGADIETMYLQHHYDTYNVTIYCFQNASSGSVTILVGGDYCEGTPTYSHSGITNGYRVTWTITFDWDFVDDQAYTIYARTVDDEPEWSSWANLDSDNTFENDLEVDSLIVAIDGDAEYGGTNAQIDDDDWFRGGVEVTASGTVQYEGSAVNFDSSYGGDVDVELYYDEGATGQIDATISDGAFSGITYTPTSASGLDTTAYFDVVINDIPTGGSDVTAAGIEITSKRDNENPSVTLTLDADSASVGYAPNTNYDDDSTIDFTASGGSDGSGSGLPSSAYSWNYTTWTDSTTKQYTGQSDGNISVFLDIRDNVGNNGTTQEAWVIIDTDSPTGFTETLSRHTGITDGYYAYVSGSTIYFNSGETDYFTVQINDDGTIQNSLFWFLVWDNESVFETSAEDSSGLPDSKNFNYNGDSSGSFIIRIVNNAGNYQTITYTATEDVANPSFSVSPDSDSNSGTGYDPNTSYDDDDTIDFTASGGSDGGSGLPTNCYSWNESAFESATTKQYGSQADGNITVSVVLRDNVGNNATEDTWIVVDTDTPESFTISWSRVNSTYPIEVYELNLSIYFDPGDECNNYTTVTVNDDGTIQNSLFWFLAWDVNSVFETNENDTSGLPDNKNFYYKGDTNGSFYIRIVNNAGNYQLINYTAYDTLDGGCGESPTTTATTATSATTTAPTTTATTTATSGTNGAGGPANYKMNPLQYYHPWLMPLFTWIPLIGVIGLILILPYRFFRRLIK